MDKKNYIDEIIISLEDLSDNIEDAKKMLLLLEWYSKQIDTLIKMGGETGNSGLNDYKGTVDSIFKALKDKVINLGKEVHVELFERGGDVKKSLAVGLGDPAADIVAAYSKSKEFLEVPGYSWSLDYYYKYMGLQWIWWTWIPEKGGVLSEAQDALNETEAVDASDLWGDVNRMLNAYRDIMSEYA
ncbi:MAG TPA: hypothetical protein PK122_05145 [Candidatus Paceibacterota bacterium]|nr:hypothetical protein [Candidatus Paceibacterota bacterium]